MNREELQTSLESKLPFDCSEYRVTALQSLLLGEEVYYSEKTLDSAAKRVLFQDLERRSARLKHVGFSSLTKSVFLRFDDETMRSVYIKDSQLPWEKLKRT